MQDTLNRANWKLADQEPIEKTCLACERKFMSYPPAYPVLCSNDGDDNVKSARAWDQARRTAQQIAEVAMTELRQAHPWLDI